MSAVAFLGDQSPFSELACFRLGHDIWRTATSFSVLQIKLPLAPSWWL